MSQQTQPSLRSTAAAQDHQERDQLLALINLKWLMSGLGYWIDINRFERDASYADHILTLALSIKHPALHACAMVLRARTDHG